VRWSVIALAGTACGRIDFATVDHDAASDAIEIDGPSGAWQFLSTNPGTPATSSSAPITVTDDVSAGDLVIPLCRGNVGAAPPAEQFTISPTGLLALAPIIQRWDSSSQYWNAFSYGVMDSSTPANTTLVITSSSFTGPSDCLVTVFRGGLAAPQLVATTETMGGAGGNVTCGPIATAAGGVAIYSSNRTTCSDAPLTGPFVQLGTDFGNPWGAWAPADGTPGSATLTDCGNSAGWMCTAISLSP